MSRPHLNNVIDTILNSLTSVPTEVFLYVDSRGTYGQSTQFVTGCSAITSIIIGTTTRKLIRKQIKDALDQLEDRLVSKRRSTTRIPRQGADD